MQAVLSAEGPRNAAAFRAHVNRQMQRWKRTLAVVLVLFAANASTWSLEEITPSGQLNRSSEHFGHELRRSFAEWNDAFKGTVEMFLKGWNDSITRTDLLVRMQQVEFRETSAQALMNLDDLVSRKIEEAGQEFDDAIKRIQGDFYGEGQRAFQDNVRFIARIGFVLIALALCGAAAYRKSGRSSAVLAVVFLVVFFPFDFLLSAWQHTLGAQQSMRWMEEIEKRESLGNWGFAAGVAQRAFYSTPDVEFEIAARRNGLLAWYFEAPMNLAPFINELRELRKKERDVSHPDRAAGYSRESDVLAIGLRSIFGANVFASETEFGETVMKRRDELVRAACDASEPARSKFVDYAYPVVELSALSQILGDGERPLGVRITDAKAHLAAALRCAPASVPLRLAQLELLSVTPGPHDKEVTLEESEALNAVPAYVAANYRFA